MSKTESKTERQGKPGPEGALQVVLDRGLEGVVEAAANVESFLQGMGVSSSDIMSVRLAFIEAANNALEYAAADSPPPTVTITHEAGMVKAVVTDHTPGFQLPDKPTLPGDDAERGRGLYLIHVMMDSVEYLREEHGNRLVMYKRFKP